MKHWKKVYKSSWHSAEEFLKEREEYSVSAIHRFKLGTLNNVWALYCNNRISALLLYGKRLLFPVFNFTRELMDNFSKAALPLPILFPLTLGSSSLHMAQGLATDMNLLEHALKKKGFIPSSSFDYELRSLEVNTCKEIPSCNNFYYKKPEQLIIRRAVMTDTDALLPLQAEYEKEEVLPPGASFNIAHTRLGLERMVAANLVFTAQLNGILIGKININAVSYTRFQIGGVYVVPEFRGFGIARAMTARLISEFAPQKNHFTLFVKKANIPACRVYNALGFKNTGDYRISYF